MQKKSPRKPIPRPKARWDWKLTISIGLIVVLGAADLWLFLTKVVFP